MPLLTLPPASEWLVVRRATCRECPNYLGPGVSEREASCAVLYGHCVPVGFARTCSVTPLPIEVIPQGPEQPQLLLEDVA